MSLTYSFSKLFKDLGLHPRSVSTAFGCRVNLAICLQVKHLASLMGGRGCMHGHMLIVCVVIGCRAHQGRIPPRFTWT